MWTECESNPQPLSYESDTLPTGPLHLSAVSYSSSIVTMALSCIISEIKRDIGRKSSFYTPLHSTPPLVGGYRRNSAKTSRVKKKREWLGYLTVKKLKICLFVSTVCMNVTDRQTDGRTDRHRKRHRPRLCIASRGKNCTIISFKSIPRCDGQTDEHAAYRKSCYDVIAKKTIFKIAAVRHLEFLKS